MSRTLVMGDLHGNFKALKQCLERSNFDYDKDTLIQLGDIVDGYSEVYECIEELAKIKHLILIKGNHDEWFKDYLKTGIHPVGWKQGGLGTAKSYLRQIGKEDMIQRKVAAWGIEDDGGYLVALNPDDVPGLHQRLLREQNKYYIDDKKRLFIHGGFNRHAPIYNQMEFTFYWDRDLWMSALSYQSMARGNKPFENRKFKIHDDFSTIYIGHTSTNNWGTDLPMKAANIFNLDTGAGFGGKLTIAEIDSETMEFWQSDSATELYPDETPR